MLRLLLAAALIFQAAPPVQEPDKAAAELLQKLEDQVMKAKTLHVEFEAAPAAAGRPEKLKGELKIGENGAFFLTVEVNERAGRVEKLTIKSDGKSIVAEGGPRGMGRADVSKWKPETVQRCLKRASNQANFLGMFLVMGRDSDPESVFEQFAPKDAKVEGKEKVGDVEATMVSFGLDLKEGPGANRMSFKVWIDPSKLRVLKREINLGPETINETTTKFELNAAFPPDFFEFQNAAMLLDARTYQAATSVLLHARYTGRLPKTLEDLARRPADLPAGVLWPEGGFWIGGAIPKDIPYASDATHFTVGALKEPIPAYSPVGAPTDRVRKFFEARVRIQLLKAGAEAFRKSSTFLPKAPQDLVKKPDSVRFWPDGGWAGAGLPSDPWGDPFIIRTEGSFTVGIAKPKGRMLKMSDLTADEKTGLDLLARPPLGEKDAAEVDALIRQLGGEKLSDRETATKGILAKGSGALHIVLAGLAREKDPEVASRLA
ncbi:MAG TPA: type II secretion system protein GspG, partial [Planctomycetota bacterium]|nr:type II secretion system protein GspG [Planctomycetota bacterium]